MKYVLSLDHITQIKAAAKSQASELIVSLKAFSRYGKIEVSQLEEIKVIFKDSPCKLILDCDLILNESQMEPFIKSLESIDLSMFHAVRVFDMGLMLYFKENSSLKIQLLLEMGNHNLDAIQTWIQYLGEHLDRVVLCPELPVEIIKEYRKHLTCPIESLAMGRILLFYTPRKLLSPYFVDHDDEEQIKMRSEQFLELLAHSEESPHKGFPIVESPYGTYMFNPKDLCILDYPEEMLASGIDYFRFDLRPHANTEILSAIETYMQKPDKTNLDLIKSLWSNSFIRGYFKANRSDVLFSKLKNTYNQREDLNYVGDVLETETGQYCVLEVKSNADQLKIGSVLSFKTPDKKWKKLKIAQFKNLEDKELKEITKGDFLKLAHLSGVSSNTRVYISEENPETIEH